MHICLFELKKIMNSTASECSQYQLQATATLAFCSVIIFEWLVLEHDPNKGCIGNYQYYYLPNLISLTSLLILVLIFFSLFYSLFPNFLFYYLLE